MAAQVAHTVITMELPQVMGDEESTIADLAQKVDVPADRLIRLVRAAAAIGLCTENSAAVFQLTEFGRRLRPDHPESIQALVRMFTEPAMLAGWAKLDRAVRTGETTFDEVFGMPMFRYLDRHPEMSALFNGAMSQATRTVAAQLPEHYDFSGRAHLIDIGGGDGTLVQGVLQANPQLRGSVFDTASGGAQAAARFAESGLAGRTDVLVGDFFAEAPDGGDVYLVKSILHDWDDDRCVRILGHIRGVIPEDGLLLILEPVLPDLVPAEGHAGMYLSDLNMLVNVGGRERTRSEFEQLCRRAGFSVSSVVSPGPQFRFSIIEARPV
ncbi:methyltransferase [Pseudonocardiaceae bacterium YIM PH 21723]|nr:methyltransferase [Pseudonocardiaceae bacterium YIM PH 21723]